MPAMVRGTQKRTTGIMTNQILSYESNQSSFINQDLFTINSFLCYQTGQVATCPYPKTQMNRLMTLLLNWYKILFKVTRL